MLIALNMLMHIHICCGHPLSEQDNKLLVHCTLVYSLFLFLFSCNLVPRGRVPLVPCATEILLSAQPRRGELILENGCRNGSETADLGGYVPP